MSECKHQWDASRLVCDSCGALGTWLPTKSQIVSLKCNCGEDATTSLNGKWLCHPCQAKKQRVGAGGKVGG